MPDFRLTPDDGVAPDARELDPFEMDWPWPVRKAEPAEPSDLTGARLPAPASDA